MGKASSNKKVARAASTGGGRTARGRRPWGWYSVLSVFVVLGVVIVYQSRADYIDSKTAAVPPAIGEDHWHSAYGIYLCDEFIPGLSDKHGDEVGIHSHGDGLIHIHPKSKRAAGKNATLKRFLDEVDVDLSADSIRVPGRKKLENGDKCGGKAGEVVVKVWDGQEDTEGKLVKGDPSDLRFSRDGQIVTIAFVPEGTELEKPPSVANLATPSDVAPPGSVPPASPGSPGSPGAPGETPPASGAPAGTEPTPPPTPPASAPPG